MLQVPVLVFKEFKFLGFSCQSACQWLCSAYQSGRAIEGGGEVSHETVLRHAHDEEVDGGKVGAVEHFRDSSGASEQAGKPALAIDDSRARVARPGEGTKLGVARQDGGLLLHLTGLALEVDPGERTDGEVRGVAALDDHNVRIVIVVETISSSGIVPENLGRRFPGYLNEGGLMEWGNIQAVMGIVVPKSMTFPTKMVESTLEPSISILPSPP